MFSFLKGKTWRWNETEINREKRYKKSEEKYKAEYLKHPEKFESILDPAVRFATENANVVIDEKNEYSPEELAYAVAVYRVQKNIEREQNEKEQERKKNHLPPNWADGHEEYKQMYLKNPKKYKSLLFEAYKTLTPGLSIPNTDKERARNFAVLMMREENPVYYYSGGKKTRKNHKSRKLTRKQRKN
jgi:hypothetical protein